MVDKVIEAGGLVRYERAQAALAECRPVDEVKDIVTSGGDEDSARPARILPASPVGRAAAARCRGASGGHRRRSS